ncbi:MAG: hypothetical protein DRM97_07780, partial [Thermoprotei archaeon]
MKIGYISTYPPTRCGIAEYTRFLVEAIYSISDYVKVYVFSDTYGKPIYPYIDGNCIVIPSFNPRAEGYYKELIASIDDVEDLDIVHIQHEYGIFHGDKCLIKLMRGLKKRNIPISITLHTVLHHNKGRRYVKLQREIAENADVVIVHSLLQEYELRAQGVDLRRIVRIPHGTKLLSDKVKADKEELGIPSDKAVLLTFGFLRRDKGLEDAIKVFRLLLREHEDVHLVIAGAPQTKEDILYLSKLTKIVMKGLPTKSYTMIRRYLPLEDLMKILSIADVILMLYKERPDHYSVSGVLHLAMGAGKPIVCSRSSRLIEYTELVPELVYYGRGIGELKILVERALYDEELREKATER